MNYSRTQLVILCLVFFSFGCQNTFEKQPQHATHVLELIANETSQVTECDAALFVQNGIAFIRVTLPDSEIVTARYSVNESNEIRFQLVRHNNGSPMVMQFLGTGETNLGHEGTLTVNINGNPHEKMSGRFTLKEKNYE